MIIDHFILNFFFGAVGIAAHCKVYDMDHPFGVPLIGLGLITMIYCVLLTSSEWQGTIGMKLLNMKVTDENFARISPLKAFVRYVASWLSGAIFCLGYIWIIFDSKKQGWHDKIAGTYVINTD